MNKTLQPENEKDASSSAKAQPEWTDEALRVAIGKAEAHGWRRCSCGDSEGLPHCGWWFKNGKARITDDFLRLKTLGLTPDTSTPKSVSVQPPGNPPSPSTQP